MFDILAITVPIYIAIALGYGLTRWGVFAKADMRAFGTFVVKVAMPALPTSNALKALEGPANSEHLDAARNLALQNPAAVAQIVRGWVNGQPA